MYGRGFGTSVFLQVLGRLGLITVYQKRKEKKVENLTQFLYYYRYNIRFFRLEKKVENLTELAAVKDIVQLLQRQCEVSRNHVLPPSQLFPQDQNLKNLVLCFSTIIIFIIMILYFVIIWIWMVIIFPIVSWYNILFYNSVIFYENFI